MRDKTKGGFAVHGTEILETPRLRLRPFAPGDAREMFQNWACDPLVTRFLRWDAHPDEGETRRVLAGWQEAYARPDFYNWAIVRKCDGALMGAIGVCPAEDAALPPEPGYALGRAFWGQGYATEALAAVAAYMFRSEGCAALSCCHALENPASGRVMRHVGFRYTGDAVYHKYDGTPVACRSYILTKEEFYDTGKQDKDPPAGR